MTERNEDKITRYLQDQMAGEEKAAFEQELQHDEHLKNELAFQETMMAGLASDFKEEKKQMLQKHEANRQNGVRRMKWYIAAAAIILLGIGLGFLFQQNNADTSYPKQIAKREFTPYPNYLVEQYRNSSQKDQPQVLVKGMQAYEKEQFEEARKALRKAVSNKKGLPLSRFYLGNVLLAMDKPEKALNQLIRIQGKLGASFQNQNKWYLALAYLHTNQVEQARAYLKKLTKQKHPLQQKARELLKELEERKK